MIIWSENYNRNLILIRVSHQLPLVKQLIKGHRIKGKEGRTFLFWRPSFNSLKNRRRGMVRNNTILKAK
jgi:hypothetical protein